MIHSLVRLESSSRKLWLNWTTRHSLGCSYGLTSGTGFRSLLKCRRANRQMNWNNTAGASRLPVRSAHNFHDHGTLECRHCGGRLWSSHPIASWYRSKLLPPLLHSRRQISRRMFSSTHNCSNTTTICRCVLKWVFFVLFG